MKKLLTILLSIAFLGMSGALIHDAITQNSKQDGLISQNNILEKHSKGLETLEQLAREKHEQDKELKDLLKDIRRNQRDVKSLLVNLNRVAGARGPGGPPQNLKAAYVKPYPPFNQGRFIKYQSFVRKKNDSGREMILFNEWKNKEFKITLVPASETTWAVKKQK